MAYDEELAHRIRECLQGTRFTERKMFGGLAFLIDGNMAVAASGKRNLMVRCAKERTEEFVAHEGASRMVMKSKPMDGWLHIEETHVDDDEQLQYWVRVGVDHASSLPSK